MFAQMTLMQITQVYDDDDDGMSEKKCATYQLLDTRRMKVIKRIW